MRNYPDECGGATGARKGFFPMEMEPDSLGLVFVGGEMTVEAVLEGCARGCFAWTGTHPLPWFSPDPRLVLFPSRFRASRRLRRLARNGKFCVAFDADFLPVMRGCAAIERQGQRGTWITENMIATYCELHRMGMAHCVSVYEAESGRLAGGLYGLSLGGVFFGESMFSASANASKLALYALCQALSEWRFDMIDCQQVTCHMLRLGAVPLPRALYLRLLGASLKRPAPAESWGDRAAMGA